MTEIDRRWADVRSLRSEQLRDFTEMSGRNGGKRTLIEGVMSRRVLAALDDWRRSGLDGILIGTLAYGHFAKPRLCDEIEMLVSDDFALTETPLFLSIRQGKALHPDSLTGILLRTATSLGISAAVAEQVRATTVVSDGIEIASPSGLVSILLGDPRARASADIVEMLRIGDVDLAGYGLPDDHLARLARLRIEADDENSRAIAWEACTGEPW